MTSTENKIPAFEATPLDSIPQIVDEARDTFKSHKTKDVQYRLRQLRKLYWGVVDLSPQLEKALHQDLRKSKAEAYLTEIDFVLSDLMLVIENLESWAKDESIPGTPAHLFMMKHRVRKEPLGTCLVIGAFNFPFQLCLAPCIGAIAAGCTVVLKPSEGSPATAMVLKQLFDAYLDPTAYKVVNGAIDETTSLLDQKWDKILYTGSTRVGKIIAKKAAETLTPVTLELGGLNPSFVTKNTDFPIAARRLMWGKTISAGQICISTNYVLAERSAVPNLIDALKAVYNDFFPNGAKSSPDLARIVNKGQFQRIKSQVDSSKGKIVLGGEMDESELYIEPTVVLVDSPSDPMITGETFGPVFSILPFDSLDEAIAMANEICPTPLSLSTFGSNQENKKVIDQVTSGGASVNDSYVHAAFPFTPFGGVGQSGSGSYRGKASFDTFSHRRTVARNPGWADVLLKVRYMPYNFSLVESTPGRPPYTGLAFDREGTPIRGVKYWLGLLARLGGKGPKGALTRWILVLATAFALTRWGGM
ncbi:probable Beta-apo-4'-carotenal oxygenase [Cephalotrichum gorgonifer]|uniref:Aldehyde dehydrogenase n=1 Tax=Cephalotrichum gorgonifer TaxID=2041049 RepID=A0AAE8MUP8_9PEZI|nr:probable Beta-apo-4'-carotenal oxygenase [Cephalotrichum gorgonifer]